MKSTWSSYLNEEVYNKVRCALLQVYFVKNYGRIQWEFFLSVRLRREISHGNPEQREEDGCLYVPAAVLEMFSKSVFAVGGGGAVKCLAAARTVRAVRHSHTPQSHRL